MPEFDYAPPIEQLLTLGKPPQWGARQSYEAAGIGEPEIPELIRMACDPTFFDLDSERVEVWAPLHAWRALAELRAAAAVQPLIELLDRLLELGDDWGIEELPRVLAEIGAPALAPVAAIVRKESQPDNLRWGLAECLTHMATRHPELRAECAGHLLRQLQRFERNDPDLNGFLVFFLVELKFAEAAPVMELAFAMDAVDEQICGRWPMMKARLGLKLSPAEEEVYRAETVRMLRAYLDR